MSEPLLLNVSGVNKRFGGLQALTDVAIQIRQGQIVGLIGPNGAGKTTFFNVITGLYQPDSGKFELAGKPYSPSAPHAVAKAGIARTFQNIRLFGEMTALENVMVGRHVRTKQGVFGAIFRHKAARLEEAAIRERSLALLDFVGIGAFANRTAKYLSYGDQRRLEIARALATDPQLLALDEPAAGMNATEKLALRELLVKIKNEGKTVLLIEHDVKLMMGLCDRITVLEYGKRIAEGAAVRDPERPGGDRGLPRGCSLMSENVLKIAGLKVAYGGIKAVKGLDLEVNRGELVTLIGANGAGKTTTLKAITGTLPACKVEGTISYLGQPLKGTQSHQLVQQKLAMVPEGRGVFTRMSIQENLLMGAYTRSDKAEIAADIEKWFTVFPRLKERSSQLAGTLSGGEQQMLAMARALMCHPTLLLLDEPSMGLAPIMVEKIFEVIREVSSQGITMLLVEQNARLALQAAHRAYVMDSGVITMTGNAQAMLNDPRVQAAYLGE
jgi:ABC-type branched-subunit amino acid transport system ATPase component